MAYFVGLLLLTSDSSELCVKILTYLFLLSYGIFLLSAILDSTSCSDRFDISR